MFINLLEISEFDSANSEISSKLEIRCRHRRCMQVAVRDPLESHRIAAAIAECEGAIRLAVVGVQPEQEFRAVPLGSRCVS